MKYQVSFPRKHDIFTCERDYDFYGYIINHAFQSKKPLKWNGLVFHWCLYNK